MNNFKQSMPIIRRGLSMLVLAGFISSIMSGCVATKTTQKPEKPRPPSLMEWDQFAPATQDNVWIGGQPSIAALDKFGDTAHSGGMIVNLRTDAEMAFLPYYDRAVTAHGFRYIRIPTKGSELDSTELEAFGHAMQGHAGPVMLHCASGGRATYLWAMLRMRDEGISADEAIEWCDSRREKPWETGANVLRAYEAERDAAQAPSNNQ